MEMKWRWSVCGVIRMNRVRNEEVRHTVGVKEKTDVKEDLKVLQWLDHVERMAR